MKTCLFLLVFIYFIYSEAFFDCDFGDSGFCSDFFGGDYEGCCKDDEGDHLVVCSNGAESDGGVCENGCTEYGSDSASCNALSAWGIVGVVIGGIALLICIGVSLVATCRHLNKNNNNYSVNPTIPYRSPANVSIPQPNLNYMGQGAPVVYAAPSNIPGPNNPNIGFTPNPTIPAMNQQLNQQNKGFNKSNIVYQPSVPDY